MPGRSHKRLKALDSIALAWRDLILTLLCLFNCCSSFKENVNAPRVRQTLVVVINNRNYVCPLSKDGRKAVSSITNGCDLVTWGCWVEATPPKSFTESSTESSVASKNV